MSDSFFGFETGLDCDALDDGLLSEDDEEDYDALNDETFGESVITGDWEEDHEKLVEITEQSRHSLISENGDLSAKIAAFLLDDEPSPKENIEPIKPKTRPPPGFCLTPNDNLDSKPTLPSLKKVCTVEEIERNLIKPTNSMLLEDLERKLIPAQNQLPLQNLRCGTGFLNLPVPHLALLNNQLPKMPSLPPPFQLSSHAPTAPPFVIQSGIPVVGARPTIGPAPPGLTIGRLPPHHPMARPRGPPLLPHTQLLRPLHPPEDEYAGLMTQREKQWLASIQLTQINTNQPFQDDYYYTMYQLRQSGTHGRKIGNSLKSARDTPSLIKPTYTPLQFENSLGKLQVGSVMAPRKIIDTDVVESVDCPSTMTTSKKVKQLLLEIEHMFSSVLLAEEVMSPLSTNEDNIDPNELFSKIVLTLLKDDKLKAVLNVRKGKTLVLRVLPHTSVSGPLAHKLITVLPSAAKRDTDQALLRALPAIRQFLAIVPMQTLVELAETLKPHISFLLPNKFGISVIANMIERAECLISRNNENPNDWLSFLSLILSNCQTCELERPVVGLPGNTLAAHLARCPSANNQDIAIFQKTLSHLNMFDKAQ